MKRRDFLANSGWGAWGAWGAMGTWGLAGTARSQSMNSPQLLQGRSGSAKNIIFLVSDGMSSGTLQMADLFHRMKQGRHSTWVQRYLDQKIYRGLMETASADSYVTDSAAASSAWGGGVRVRNGRLNVGSGNQLHKPIWQKFQASGKKAGCVTTVPITHATPAGFCVNNKSRNAQAEIAEAYLNLKFDVMLGGGQEYFQGSGRNDNRNLFQEFRQAGFHVAQNKAELLNFPQDQQPVLGVFHPSGLPYSIDQLADPELQNKIPTLAEMTRFALNRLQDADQGFVLQVEAGKVDWAAHANDTPALIYEQLAFDEALKVALDFADADQQTLVVVTTDHGNANPGIHGCSNSLQNFSRLMNFKRSHSWILSGIKQTIKSSEIIERIEQALGIVIQSEEADRLRQHLSGLNDEEIRDDYQLPFSLLAETLKKYTSVAWVGNDHTGDFVELAMAGPGSELLTPFVKNTELHNFMLNVTECVSELVAN